MYHTYSCDCYILKDILQNWSDEEAALILQKLHSVMRTDHKLLVIETIMHTGSYSEERVSCMSADRQIKVALSR